MGSLAPTLMMVLMAVRLYAATCSGRRPSSSLGLGPARAGVAGAAGRLGEGERTSEAGGGAAAGGGDGLRRQLCPLLPLLLVRLARCQALPGSREAVSGRNNLRDNLADLPGGTVIAALRPPAGAG